MLSQQLSPDLQVYNAVLGALALQEAWPWAVQLFSQLRDADGYSLHLVMRACPVAVRLAKRRGEVARSGPGPCTSFIAAQSQIFSAREPKLERWHLH